MRTILTLLEESISNILILYVKSHITHYGLYNRSINKYFIFKVKFHVLDFPKEAKLQTSKIHISTAIDARQTQNRYKTGFHKRNKLLLQKCGGYCD